MIGRLRQADEQPCEYHVKLLMVGDSGVGKTCMLIRYTDDDYSHRFITTIGIDFKIKILKLDGAWVKLQIWDTAGQERFRTITVSYFRGAHGIFLVFDITERHTFQSVEQWIEQIQQSADGSINLLLVGNKCDCEDSARQVSYAEGVEAARRIGCKYLETSARTRVNIKEAFETLALDTKNRLARGSLGDRASSLSGSGPGAEAGVEGAGKRLRRSDGRTDSGICC